MYLYLYFILILNHNVGTCVYMFWAHNMFVFMVESLLTTIPCLPQNLHIDRNSRDSLLALDHLCSVQPASLRLLHDLDLLLLYKILAYHFSFIADYGPTVHVDANSI